MRRRGWIGSGDLEKFKCVPVITAYECQKVQSVSNPIALPDFQILLSKLRNKRLIQLVHAKGAELVAVIKKNLNEC